MKNSGHNSDMKKLQKIISTIMSVQLQAHENEQNSTIYLSWLESIYDSVVFGSMELGLNVILWIVILTW